MPHSANDDGQGIACDADGGEGADETPAQGGSMNVISLLQCKDKTTQLFLRPSFSITVDKGELGASAAMARPESPRRKVAGSSRRGGAL